MTAGEEIRSLDAHRCGDRSRRQPGDSETRCVAPAAGGAGEAGTGGHGMLGGLAERTGSAAPGPNVGLVGLEVLRACICLGAMVHSDGSPAAGSRAEAIPWGNAGSIVGAAPRAPARPVQLSRGLQTRTSRGEVITVAPLGERSALG